MREGSAPFRTAAAAPRHAAAIEATPPPAPATCELSTAPSGLQWCDVAVGTGGEPKAGGLVKVHYTAALVGDGGALGPEFDNSYKRGQPLIVKVIRGWCFCCGVAFVLRVLRFP